jgi:hypothetical protein
MNRSEIYQVLLFSVSGISDAGMGYWKRSDNMEAQYFGIRKMEASDTIYGWILMDTKETIKIKEYAFNRKNSD